MTDEKTPPGDGIAGKVQAALEARAAAGDRMAQRDLRLQAFRKIAEDRLMRPHDATTGEVKP